MTVDNAAREWLLKELTVAQFIEMVDYDNELKSRQYVNTPKTLKDLQSMQDRLNNG